MDELGRELQQAKKDLGEEQKAKRDLQALAEVAIHVYTLSVMYSSVSSLQSSLPFDSLFSSPHTSHFLGLSTSQ